MAVNLDQLSSESKQKLREMMATEPGDSSSKWVVDSGCTSHMSFEKENFMNLIECDENVAFGDGSTTKVTHKGNIRLICKNQATGGWVWIILHNLLYVPALTKKSPIS